MQYRIGDRVNTADGVGTVKKIERIGPTRYGVLHDTFPRSRPKIFTDDILYYFGRELTPIEAAE